MTTERAELLTSIYNRYSQALRSTEHLSLDVVQFALTLAIQDVAAALEIISKRKTLNDCQIEELTYWLDANYRLTLPEEAVAEAIRLLETKQQPPALCPNCQNLGQYLDQHESELYNASLSPATTDAITVIERLKDQLIRINDWLAEHAPDEYHQPGDTADAMIAVADTLRGQVAKLRHDLATAIAERDESRSLLAKLANWLIQHGGAEGGGVDHAISVMTSQAAELDALRQQLAQMDADNARLTDELRTLRSWSTAPTGNGKSHPAAILTAAQSADETPTPWNDAMLATLGDATADYWWNDAMLTALDDATADYWHGIAAGRWTWRKLPKSVRLAMVRHVLSFGPEARAMSMSEFDAIKPHWMPGAGSHPVTFGVPWSTLSDLRVEIEVPA